MSVSDPLHGVIQIPLAPEQNEPQVPPTEAVAFLVRSVRRLRQWKKETLADFARVPLSTVERVERGEKISAENRDRITQAFGFDRGAFTGHGSGVLKSMFLMKWQTSSDIWCLYL